MAACQCTVGGLHARYDDVHPFTICIAYQRWEAMDTNRVPHVTCGTGLAAAADLVQNVIIVFSEQVLWPSSPGSLFGVLRRM